jgi:hypothetical protein
MANSDLISGGTGGAGSAGGAGGAGVLNEKGATIVSLDNEATGTISGGIGGPDAPGGAGVANFGTITALTNSGIIRPGANGDAILSAGAQASIGTLINSGQIDGAVELLGRSGDTLDNLGLIVGTIGIASGDILSNQGQIYGDVMLAGGDALTDTGVIHGDVTLGASDTVDISSGGVTGAITASIGDLLKFGGNFGVATIDDFAATGPTHDTLELGRSGFGDYAALSSSMSQVGSDVVIRLGAANSLVLADVNLSSLAPADFKFG